MTVIVQFLDYSKFKILLKVKFKIYQSQRKMEKLKTTGNRF